VQARARRRRVAAFFISFPRWSPEDLRRHPRLLRGPDRQRARPRRRFQDADDPRPAAVPRPGSH